MAKAKGTTLIGAVRYLRKNKAKAREALPPDLHHYLEERITESRWYPESDLHLLLKATLEMNPGPRDQILAQLGTVTAREHLEGIYSHLSGGRSDSIARRAVALWSSQHDTGRFVVKALSANEDVMTVHDFGHPSDILCGILGGYLAETLRIDGASDVEIQKTACVLKGDPACSWRRAWNRSDARSPKQ